MSLSEKECIAQSVHPEQLIYRNFDVREAVRELKKEAIIISDPTMNVMIISVDKFNKIIGEKLI